MRRYTVEITGTTPLLMHHDSITECDRVNEWIKDPANKGKSTPGDDRTPAWKWMTYLYHDTQRIAIPAQNLMTCLRKAASNFRQKGQTTFKSLSQSAILFADDNLDFDIGGRPVEIPAVLKLEPKSFADQVAGARAMGFDLDVRGVALGQGKQRKRNVRVRPRFDHWRAVGRFDVLVDESEMPTSTVAEIFQYAGYRVGLGDWRPGCDTPGRFGQFDVKIKKG